MGTRLEVPFESYSVPLRHTHTNHDCNNFLTLYVRKVKRCARKKKVIISEGIPILKPAKIGIFFLIKFYFL